MWRGRKFKTGKEAFSSFAKIMFDLLCLYRQSDFEDAQANSSPAVKEGI